jgi:hypothetical protein
MIITEHKLVIAMTDRDLRIWLQALKLAAVKAKGTMIPWHHCPFYQQHEQLVKITGWGTDQHEWLGKELAPKEETTQSC